MANMSDDQYRSWKEYEYPQGLTHYVDDGVTAVANAAELLTGNRFAARDLSIRLLVGAVIVDLQNKGRLTIIEDGDVEQEGED